MFGVMAASVVVKVMVSDEDSFFVVTLDVSVIVLAAGSFVVVKDAGVAVLAVEMKCSAVDADSHQFDEDSVEVPFIKPILIETGILLFFGLCMALDDKMPALCWPDRDTSSSRLTAPILKDHTTSDNIKRISN